MEFLHTRILCLVSALPVSNLLAAAFGRCPLPCPHIEFDSMPRWSLGVPAATVAQASHGSGAPGIVFSALSDDHVTSWSLGLWLRVGHMMTGSTDDHDIDMLTGSLAPAKI
jgi:hypothetical protein